MMKSRRELLIATGALALYAQQTKHTAGKPAPLRSSKKIRLGIAGGGFGSGFSFHEHANCEVTAVTDLRTDRRATLQQVYRCRTAYESLEQMLGLEKRLDAVAIFTPPLHYQHAELAIKRGVHVYSAAPLEEAAKLKALKENTGLRYMMGETSRYREGCIYAAMCIRPGASASCSEPNGSRIWRWGLPPLQYPTHSLGYLVGVTGERIRTVSAEWRTKVCMAVSSASALGNLSNSPNRSTSMIR
jgi:predicted dehydrogenase